MCSPCSSPSCDCLLVPGPGTTVGGNGAPATPFTVGVQVSGQAGNALVLGPDGLYVPAGTATVQTGCGLSGDGSAATPVQVAVAAWPYACDLDTNGGRVYCDGSGVLRTEPPPQATFVQHQETQDFASPPVPAGFDNVVTTHTLSIVNPSECREAFVMVEGEVDIDFNLPANSGAAGGITTDEMQYFANRGGSAAQDVHGQVTKLVHQTIPAGGTLLFELDITLGRGSGGATYNRIQSFLRAFIFVL